MITNSPAACIGAREASALGRERPAQALSRCHAWHARQCAQQSGCVERGGGGPPFNTQGAATREQPCLGGEADGHAMAHFVLDTATLINSPAQVSPHLGGGVDGHAVLHQHAGTQHGQQLKQQVGLHGERGGNQADA